MGKLQCSLQTKGMLSGQLNAPKVIQSATSDYNKVINKPMINDVELVGNKTGKQLGLQETLEMADTSDIDTILYGI